MNDTILSNEFDDTLNPFDRWEGKNASEMLTKAWSSWLLNEKRWTSFLTLTFRYPVSTDIAMMRFKKLIRSLNEGAFGRHYTRKVGHSYFSYACALEYQNRDVIHFHVLIDCPVNHKLIRTRWYGLAGITKVGTVRNLTGVVNYVCKSAAAQGEMFYFAAKKEYKPTPLPSWWY